MSCLFRILSITIVALFFGLALSGIYFANATSVSNNLQVMLETEGNFLIEWFSVSYQIHPRVSTFYTIRAITLEDENPFINVDIRFGKLVYELNRPTFDQARLRIWSSLFTMENGSSERVHFSSSESFHYNFHPRIHNPYGNYSGQYLCTYSFNLSQPIKDAKTFFANTTGYINATQSDLEFIIEFTTTDLIQGISEGGQERQLRFDFVCQTHELEHFSFSLSIPDSYDFIDKQTLNDLEMYETPNRVTGIDRNDMGYDSLGNPYWMGRTVVNWWVPRVIAFWETPPFSWILSALVGGLIISIPISFVSSYLWNRLQKPKLTINVVTNVDVPAIHPRTEMGFYRLITENRGKTTAYDSEVYITFKNLQNNQLFSLKGKWDRTPEPIGPIQNGGKSSVWPAFVPFSELVNIRPDIPETFCLIVKDNENFCYAFNAKSYFYNYKNPKWQLPIGQFIAEVEIRSGNTRTFSRFLVENNGSNVRDVRISKIN